MKPYKKTYELKNAAKDTLDGKYKTAVLLCFLSFLITEGVSGFVDLFLPPAMLPEGISIPACVIQCIASLLLSWVLGVLQLGVILFFLNMACGQPYQVNDLLYGYRHDSSKALVISGVLALVNAVCLMPYQLLLQAYWYTRSPQFLTAAVIALAIGACFYVPLSLGLSLSYYLMLDFPEKTAKETLALSLRIMRGHKKRLFYLECSFLPLIFLCVCTLFVGFLWLIPYMDMTFVCFYLDLMKPQGKGQAPEST